MSESSSLGSVTLDITIKKAEGLAGKDWSIIKGKTSDPYVNICIGNRIVKRTTIQYKTCNPEWDESFQITVENGNDPVSLEIYDHDTLTENDPMGSVVIFPNSQNEIVESSLETKWYDIEKSNSAADATGRIQVQLGVTPVDA